MSQTVSVVIPTYNCSRYILNAIDSVLTQTYPNHEVVVINDGSNDDTQEILTPYIEQRRIKYFFQDNQGLSSARNAGLRLIKGEFVKFLDSDDILYPNLLEQQVRDLSQSKTDISVSNYALSNPEGKINPQYLEIDTHNPLCFYLEKYRGPIHSFLFRKKALNGITFDETLKSAEDADFVLRLLINGARLSQIQDIGCCYCLWDGSMSSDEDKIFIHKCLVANKISGILLTKTHLITPELAKVILWSYSRMIQKCYLGKYSVSQLIPNTLNLLTFLYQREKKGIKKIIYRILGPSIVARLQYFKYTFKDPQYKNKMLNENSFWKNF